jgi:hypothetical protein
VQITAEMLFFRMAYCANQIPQIFFCDSNSGQDFARHLAPIVPAFGDKKQHDSRSKKLEGTV